MFLFFSFKQPWIVGFAFGVILLLIEVTLFILRVSRADAAHAPKK